MTTESKPVTMEQIAALAGVSTITVSRALRDSPSVTPATRERVKTLAEAAGYRFNHHARNLRLRRQHNGRIFGNNIKFSCARGSRIKSLRGNVKGKCCTALQGIASLFDKARQSSVSPGQCFEIYLVGAQLRQA
jgi:hypothetical protein